MSKPMEQDTYKGKTVEEEINTAPLSVLRESYENNTQVLITCLDNKKLRGRVKSFAKDCSMVLENVTEWTEEVPGKVSGNRFITMKFLRGDIIDSVIPTECDKNQQAPIED